jgi:eukaryotic-like serine/threonine-protein kinase
MSQTGLAIFEISKAGSLRASLTLRKKVGKPGASGTVWEHPEEPTKVIKLYHDKECSKFEDKARTMIKVKYNRPHVDHFDFAWPEALVVNESGSFLGFKMPFFGGGWIDLESLMQAREAEDKYGVGDRERLLIAANLAMAVKELHLLGVYCTDLKPDNIRVYLRNWSIGIIDCDGMSVIDIAVPNGKRFHADKSTPEFWAPENIGVKPENFEDPEAHDRFALATIIFMLLNRGLHPFQGKMSFEILGAETTAGKIKSGLYPHGPGKRRIEPHQDSLYPFWSKEMRGLFDRAFSTTTARPSAEEWLSYLRELSGKVGVCDKRPKFHVSQPQVGCPVCARDQAIANQRRAASFGTVVSASVAPLSPSPVLTQSGTGVAGRLSSGQQAQVPGPISTTRSGPYQPPPQKTDSGFAGRAAVAFGVLILLLIGTVVLVTKNDQPSPTSVQPKPTPVIARCSQPDVYSQAVDGGVQKIREYLGECPNGAYAKAARETIESILFGEASSCLKSTCSVDACVAKYSRELPQTSFRLIALRREADARKNSMDCRPSAPAPPPKPRPEAALREFGLFGTFAFDCRQRVSETNAYKRTMFQGDEIVMIEDGPLNAFNTFQLVFRIEQAESAGNDKVALTLLTQPFIYGRLQYVTLLVNGGSFRYWRSTYERKTLVDNGIVLSTGQQSLWNTRCS